jgi:hypothetical protein
MAFTQDNLRVIWVAVLTRFHGRETKACASRNSHTVVQQLPYGGTATPNFPAKTSDNSTPNKSAASAHRR